MKLPRIYFLLLIVSLSFSCSKEKPDPPTYYLTQDMYDYVIFPVGSWWVYKDSATGVLDTVRVVSQEKKIIEHDGDGNGIVDYKYETLYEKKFKTFPFKVLDYYRGVIFGLENSQYGLEIKNAYCLEQAVSIYKNDIPLGKISNSDNISYLNKYDSLKIENKFFYQIKLFLVRRIKTLGICPEDYPLTSKHDGLYYYAKNVGLIKRALKDSVIWELVNYHINK